MKCWRGRWKRERNGCLMVYNGKYLPPCSTQHQNNYPGARYKYSSTSPRSISAVFSLYEELHSDRCVDRFKFPYLFLNTWMAPCTLLCNCSVGWGGTWHVQSIVVSIVFLKVPHQRLWVVIQLLFSVLVWSLLIAQRLHRTCCSLTNGKCKRTHWP